MKTLLKLLIVLGVLAGIGVGVYFWVGSYLKERHRPRWRLAEVKQGRITSVINSTGTVKPVLSISVGSFVSGPVKELSAEFNQPVKKNDRLARIDPRMYEANVSQNQATLTTRLADVKRAKALLEQAEKNEQRAVELRKEDPAFVAEQEMDTLKYAKLSLAAQVEVAEAAVEQARAALDYSKTQLEYTVINAPEDGIIINRKIDPGQTLAAQFQTPELFIIGVRMREKMHLHAAVDEADIGFILRAKEQGRKATFTVDAYPDELFEGLIEEVRFSSMTVQNVVTYPVVVGAPNPDLKLLPGMTASISFCVDERKDVVKIPNAALRFYPNPQHVRPEDRPILEGRGDAGKPDADQSDQPERKLSAEERAELRRQRARRHVWMVEGESLKAVSVSTGISDSQFTELVSGELTAGQELVTGLQQ